MEWFLIWNYLIAVSGRAYADLIAFCYFIMCVCTIHLPDVKHLTSSKRHAITYLFIAI